MITVVVADDQTLFRSMLEKQLATDRDIIVEASVDNGEEAVRMALKYKPDLVILDRQMPVMDGLTALIEIKEKLPKTKVVILTAFEDSTTAVRAMEAQADGYLIKDMTPEVLTMAIKCICHDLVLIHKSAYSMMIANNRYSSKNEKGIQYGGFTFDQVDIMIMKQIVEGKTNKEIAKMLDYSEGTIKNRISNIFSTTGLSDRTQISVFALKNNIV